MPSVMPSIAARSTAVRRRNLAGVRPGDGPRRSLAVVHSLAADLVVPAVFVRRCTRGVRKVVTLVEKVFVRHRDAMMIAVRKVTGVCRKDEVLIVAQKAMARMVRRRVVRKGAVKIAVPRDVARMVRRRVRKVLAAAKVAVARRHGMTMWRFRLKNQKNNRAI